MARVQVLTNSVCLLQLQADHDKTAIGCLMQVSAFTFDTFQLDFVADSYLYVQCMFYPNSDESKVEFVHVCRSRHEEATMIIVDDWYEFDYQNPSPVFWFSLLRRSIRERIRSLPASARISAADGGEPWSVLTVELNEGANEVGVLLRIATALNATAIPMMNISTFDSNYVIVPTSCCSIAGA